MERSIQRLEGVRGVLFDLFDTLISTRGLQPSVTWGVEHLYRSLRKSGFNVKMSEFRRRYQESYRRCLRLRVEELREVGNNIWVSSTLRSLGYHVSPEDPSVLKAVEAQFNPLIRLVRLLPYVSETLMQISTQFKTGLVTNFTYTPTVHQILRRLDIDRFFQTVQVSHQVGFRKPHSKIFQAALNSLSITPSEAVMVGDSPTEDVLGAFQIGMRSILIHRLGLKYKMDPQIPQPDLIIRSIRPLSKIVM